MIYNNNPFSLEPPPPKKLFSDFLSSLPTSPTPPPEPPPPQNILIQAIQELGRKSQKGAKAFQDAGTAQKEAWKKFLANPTAENSFDIVGDMALPMAVTTGRAFKSVAAYPAAGDFLDNLYSRLNAALIGGPGKAQGKQWLAHIKKNVPQGEVSHTGLDKFLNNNLDRVITSDEVLKAANENPVRLDEIQKKEYEDYFPNFGSKVKIDPNTYKETIFQSNLPKRAPSADDAVVAKAQENLTKLEDQLDDLRGALEEARRDPRDFGTAMLIRGDMEVVRSKIGQQKLRIEQHTLKQNPKHFSGIPNQVAWLRSAMGELDGQKVLAFGEGQSDPHQLARVFGYLSPDGTALPEEAARLKSRLDKAQENLDALEKLPKDKITTELDYNLRKAFLKADDADHMYGQYVGQSEGSGGVLPLPFQKDSEWSELLLKRALHEVSQKDLEGIVFPTGRAVSQAVGMPEGGRKFYDKELPNQLMEYLKKQFGVETAPQQIMSDVPATIRDVSNLLDPMMVGPRQYAVPDLPGPLPEGYEMDFRNILNALGTDPMESQPTSILDQLGRSGVGRIVNILNSENPVSNVGLDTFMNDYKIAAQNLYKPPQSFGTFIPVPEEARQKILTDGQRLWAAFLAAGLPSLLSQQKKDDPKRTRSKGS